MIIINDPFQTLEYTTSVTIGVFDGVHLGHKSIIERLCEHAHRQRTKSCVVTFNPHPQYVLGKFDVPMIVSFEDRCDQLKTAGVDIVACIQFTKKFSLIPAREFILDLIIQKLRVRSIVSGPNFYFGRKREGDINLLKDIGNSNDVEIDIVQPKVANGERISSTAIRKLIIAGNVEKASKFLGYDFYVKGVVVEGEKRGRKLGFPTANIAPTGGVLPKLGVYATKTTCGGEVYRSMTNVGIRPTFENNELIIETNIFDFTGDIYAMPIKVEFVSRIRDEKRFDGIEQLSAQIKKDAAQIKDILSGSGS